MELSVVRAEARKIVKGDDAVLLDTTLDGAVEADGAFEDEP